MTIEYRITRTDRFHLTKAEYSDEGRRTGGVQTVGDWANPDIAYEVGTALAKADADRLGLPPGDMGVIFPQHPSHADADTRPSDPTDTSI